MTKKIKTTYDRFIESLSEEDRKDFEEGYKELLLSELLIALMQGNDISIRKLAKAAGLSPTVIQNVRSGKKNNLTLQSFLRILDVLGYALVVERSIQNSRLRSRFVLNNDLLQEEIRKQNT